MGGVVAREGAHGSNRLKVWIDLANSPHPRLFAPIADALTEAGAEVLVTVRDHAQTVDLARRRWPAATVLGAPSSAPRFRKLAGLGRRTWQLVRWARSACPDVALSHNSYAQLAAARLIGIPAITAMDYEHQPANHLAFRLADRVLVPEAVPVAALRRQGAATGKTVRYPGLKEEVYLARAVSDPGVLARLGIERSPETPIVVARFDPAGAAYHRRSNPLFLDCVAELSGRGATCIVLARTEQQRAAVRRLGLSRCVVPEAAVDGGALLLAADLFLGAGGTMTREAALLGVPTYSVFAGRRPAVDRLLETRGRLKHVTDPAQITLDGVRRAPDHTEIRAHAALIERTFCTAVLELGRAQKGRP